MAYGRGATYNNRYDLTTGGLLCLGNSLFNFVQITGSQVGFNQGLDVITNLPRRRRH